MKEKIELLECLSAVEMKLHAMQNDIRNLRARIEGSDITRKAEQGQPTFFSAYKGAEDSSIIGFKHV